MTTDCSRRRGAQNYATTGSALFGHTVAAGATINAADVAELRQAIDAFRFTAGLGASFSGGPTAGQSIMASDFNGMIAALDQARAVYGQSGFTYMGVPLPAQGGNVYGQHILQLREALK